MASVIEFTISLDICDILTSLGYTNVEKSSHETMHKIEEIQNEFSNKFQFRAIYRIVDFLLKNNIELFTKTGCIESPKIVSLAQKANRLMIALVSLYNFDKTEDNDLLYDYIIHGIGTAAIGKAVDFLLNTIELETGLHTSLPFSPGYCDWDITSGQKFIFNSIDSSVINVKLVPQSFSMLPVHSISFVSLMGTKKMDRNPCHFCNMKKCPTRRR